MDKNLRRFFIENYMVMANKYGNEQPPGKGTWSTIKPQ